MIEYYIHPEACTGCGLCKRECPQEAILGERKEPHTIDQTLCVKCGVCQDVCSFDAIGVR